MTYISCNVEMGFLLLGNADRVNPAPLHDLAVETVIMRQYMKVLQSELVGGEMAYLAYQAGIINETTFENNLINTEPNKSSAEAVFEAIEIEMTQYPSVFHKFVNLLQNMGNEVLKQVAVEMQEQYGMLMVI